MGMLPESENGGVNLPRSAGSAHGSSSVDLEAENAELRACANGFALNALQALRQMTGSANNENPWLGVTAAVALLQADLEHTRAQITELTQKLADAGAALQIEQGWRRKNKADLEHTRQIVAVLQSALEEFANRPPGTTSPGKWARHKAWLALAKAGLTEPARLDAADVPAASTSDTEQEQ